MPDYIPGAEPFYFQGGPIGCLLLHGFTGTPYEMRGLGRYLSETNHYTVLGPALAGHATSIEELLHTDWRHWYESAEHGYYRLKAECDQVFAVGLSMGGVLALHLAAHWPLSGVAAVSTPAYIDHPWVPYFRRLPFLTRLIPYIPKNASEDDTQDPTVAAGHPSYERTPIVSARSLILDLIPHVRQHLPGINTPALLLQGRQDRTIPANSMPILYSELGSNDKECAWLEPSGHLALEDYAKGEAFRLIGDFIARHQTANTFTTSQSE